MTANCQHTSTHRGALFEDRLTREVGIFTNFRIEGDRLLGDFQAFDSFREDDARKFNRLFELAEKMPERFGLSIVFSATSAWATPDGDIPMGRFPNNDSDRLYDENNPPEDALFEFPSIRVEEVSSADFVDAPAANQRGLFSQIDKSTTHKMTKAELAQKNDELVAEAEQLDAKIAELEAKLAEGEEEDTGMESLAEENAKLQEENEAMKVEIEELKAKLAEHEEEMAKAAEATAEGEEQLEAARGELAKKGGAYIGIAGADQRQRSSAVCRRCRRLHTSQSQSRKGHRRIRTRAWHFRVCSDAETRKRKARDFQILTNTHYVSNYHQ